MKRNLSRVLKQKLPALKKFFASDPHVLGVWLFGSQTDSTATAQSDIDLAVLFDHDIDLKEEIQFEIAVSNILKTDAVDIVNLNRAIFAIPLSRGGWQIVVRARFCARGEFH
jgi:predicted nucleotidyltransferase